MDNLLGIYRVNSDVAFYLLAGSRENEILLLEVLNGFYEALFEFLK